MDHNISIPVSSRGFFSPEECKRILQLSEGLPESDGAAGYQEKTTGIRESRIRSVSPNESNQWLYTRLQAAAFTANKLYKFEVKGFRETLQIASYTGGGYFDWHVDIGPGVSALRKLSISVQLSDDSDYTGGDLEFMGVEDAVVPRGLGDVVFFPSFLVHRVTPVTSGCRWSLVAWVHGPQFR